MNVIRGVFRLLAPGERRLVRRVLLLGAVAGFVQSLAVGAFLPFIAAVVDPSAALESGWARWLGRFVSLDSPRDLVLTVASGALGLIVVSNLLGVLALRRIQLAAWNINHHLTRRLLAHYLRRPWSWFLGQHTSAIGQKLLEEVGVVVHGALLPFLVAATRGVEGLLVVALLLAVSPWITLAAGAFLGVAYLVTWRLLRSVQDRLGTERAQTSGDRYHVTMETLAAVKEIKAAGVEGEFLRRLEATGPSYVRTRAWSAVLGEVPRYVMEVLALGTVLGVTLFLALDGTGLQPRLPVLGALAFAGYKLVPALHRVFSAASSIRYAGPAVAALTRDLEEARGDAGHEAPHGPAPVMARSLELIDAVVRYPGAESDVLTAVDLRMERGDWIGIVGPTGAGKSTLVDAILGLLPLRAGRIEVDGTPLDPGDLPAWRRRIGYVPQRIFLSDDTLEANIAFGLPQAQVDAGRVRAAAAMAGIEDVVAALPEGYRTRVGERGMRLSGGQAQRVGLARALYADPDLLLLDEATSNLDAGTEEAVLSALRQVAAERTVVMVAHRIATVRTCDRIVLLDGGRIVDQGTFDELHGRSELFRVMARGVEL